MNFYKLKRVCFLNSNLWNFSNSNQGSVSIFLCIVLMVIILMSMVLVDGSRISSGRVQAERAVMNAATSSLACYSSRLKNQFGLFSLSEMQRPMLEGNIQKYLLENLESNGLFNFKIEKLKVVKVDNLAENEVIKSQILKYMRYRAPKELIENVWQKISQAKSAPVMAKTLELKTKVDVELSDIADIQKKLKESIDGSFNETKKVNGIEETFVNINEAFVNGFNKGDGRKDLINSFISLYSKRLEEQKEQHLKEQILSEKYPLDQHPSEQQPSEQPPSEQHPSDQQPSEQHISSEKAQNVKLIEDIREIDVNHLKQLWSNIKIQMTQKYIEPNLTAIQNIKTIAEAGEKATLALQDLNKYTLEYAKDMTADFKNSIVQDVEGLNDIILENGTTQSMLDKTTENVNTLKKIVTNMEQLESSLFLSNKFILPQVDLQYLIAVMTEGLDSYKNITFDFVMSNSHNSQEYADKREIGKNEVLDLLNFSKVLGKNFDSAGINVNLLPSRIKNMSKKSSNDKNMSDNNEIDNIGKNALKKYEENALGTIENEVDFKNTKASFSINAFNFVSSMGKYLAAAKEEILDKLYINEYIMGTFKNSVKALEIDNKKIEDKDLRGKQKELRKTFFDNEVEYILGGASADNVNKALCMSQLLLMRFSLNTIHVYTDAQKKEAANTLAIAVAGWWTGGAGVPLLSNLIMCAWGMSEAVIDVKQLMEGHSIPFYKLKGDWKLQIGIEPDIGNKMNNTININNTNKTNAAFCFNYYDYLRLFLLFVAEDKKLSRIQDLIQLDMQQTEPDFTMVKSHTGLSIEAQITMNYLFTNSTMIPINSAIMPFKSKTLDGRHSFKVVIYEGY